MSATRWVDGISIIGHFRASLPLGGRPSMRPTWRVLTSETSVALRLSELFGGDLDSDSGAVTVTTCSHRLPILVDGEQRVSSLPQAGICRSAVSLEGERMGSVGRLVGEPLPEGSVSFLLADDPDLGLFALRSTARGFVGALPALRQALAGQAQPVLCTLWLRPVEFLTPRGFPVRYVEPAAISGQLPVDG